MPPRKLNLESLEARQVLAGTPVITEFAAQTTNVLDEDNQPSDWIEIHNPDAAPLNLTGWHLTDNDSNLAKWTFPSASIPAGGYLVVYASSKDRPGTGPLGQLHTNFSLGVNGEYLGLVEPDGTTIAQQFISNDGKYPQQFTNISYGLAPVTNEETYFLAPTPGAANGGPTSSNPSKQIIINELMYHPASEDIGEEYIELYNAGSGAVDVTGWQFTKGVTFTIPANAGDTPRSIPAGGYLVVAADAAKFAAAHPAVNSAIVVGGWTGQLSNRFEAVELEDSGGNRIDQVEYADEGDWADRVRGPDDIGHQGWIWSTPADGGGKSLELVNAALSNNQGQNWRPSTPVGGTPGAANSVIDTDIAPLVTNVEHSPAIPTATQPITVTAELRDELTTGLTATLFWRLDKAGAPNSFQSAAMFDDGLHGDGTAGDGVYGVSISAQANGAIVEYYVRATDAGSNARTWPAPTDALGTQGANALLQVDNSFTGAYTPGADPIIRLIMTENERAELADIGDSNQSPANETNSDAQMNATFVVFDGAGTEVRYLSSLRNRGGSSRIGPPNNYHLSIPKDNPWLDRTDWTINAYYPQSQVLGSAVMQYAGQVTGDSVIIGVRVNNTDLAETGNRMYGHYVLNEVRNSDYVEHHFPEDPDGNLYTVTNDFGDQGDLRYEGTNPDAYRDAYYKQTNDEYDDWSDLIHLTDVLNNSPDANYLNLVSAVADVPQWMRYMAVDTLLANREGGLATGTGDDYLLYSGVSDPRFKLVSHDLDTLLGISGGGFQANASIFNYENVDGLSKLLNNPQTVPLYYEQLLDVINHVMAPEVFNPLVDQLLSSWVPPAAIATIKSNAAARRTYVASIIPTALTVNSTLATLGGYLRTTSATTVNLSGTGHAAQTRSVLVNGSAATWNAKNATWSMNAMATPLSPGLNRVVVQAFDGAGGTGNIIAEQFVDIWYDTGASATLTGTIATNRTLTAAGGPYHVTGNVTVPAGVTLTIEPGASLFFDANTQLTINGRLLAEGTQYKQIRFTRVPNTTNNWNGVQLLNTTQDNRLTYAVLEWSSPTINSNQGMLGVENSTLTVDHSYFDHAERRRLRSRDSSLIVRNSTFTQIFADAVAPSTDNISEQIWGGGIPDGGHWIIENNVFGLLKGHNDGIDFDAPQGEGHPLAQVLGNTFFGAGDDATDMTGNAYFEGNRFLNFHKDQYNLDPGQSNVNSSSTGNYWSVRNIYYNVDHATLTKETAFTTFQNNTVYGPDYSAIYFDLAGQTSGPGRGAAVDNSIFADLSPEGLFGDVIATTEISLNNSIVPASDVSRGTGNIAADPRLANPTGLDFHLLPGSPAIGTGINGIDMGALVAAGATISGEPAQYTSSTSATLKVAGPGVTHYKYSVDGGAFTAVETPIATPIELTGLSNGTHSVRVIGKNAAGVWQAEAAARQSKTWTVQTSGVLPLQVVLNEVLATNSSAFDLGGTHPDAIELYNRGDVAVSLAGMSLSDDADHPTKYVFPAGTTIPARGYLVVYADSGAAVGSELHANFSLRSEGEGVFFYDAAQTLVDSLEFGLQIPDYSVARLTDGAWGLAQPTIGAANRSQALGNPKQVKINEWFTKGAYTVGGQTHSDDFIELYNADALPVALGGLHLSDNPADAPTRHEIAPYSYIAGAGYSVFLADNSPEDGANHLNFELEYLRGWIALADANGAILDQVLYNPQTANVSQGRVPDGGATYAFFASPTPGLDSSPPSAPGNLHFTLNTDTRVDIAWDASSDPQSGVLEYHVYRGGALLATTTDLSYSDTTVIAGTSYTYEVAAVNGDEVEGPKSSPISTGVDLSPPSVPGNVHATIAGNTQVNLTWNASSDPQSGVGHYTVFRNGISIGTPTGTTFNDTAVPLGAAVTYRISASNTDNIASAQSAPITLNMFQEGVAPAAYAGTVDTYLNENNTAQNNGNANNVRFDGEDPLEEIGLIRWDISSIPAGSVVQSASMTVNITNNTTNQVYEIYAAKRSWNETATFVNAQTGTPWGTPGARNASDRGTDILGTIASNSNGLQTFALNAAGVALVNQWINGGATNFGFIISDDSNTDGAVFDSSEATNAANRPRFTVAYTSAPPADTTPPSVPTGLFASNNGASNITIGWNFSTDAESGVSSYNVFRDGVQVGTSTSTSYIDTGRTPGVSYSYTVSAVNGANLQSAQSTPLSASIPIDNTAPTAPSGLSATDDGATQVNLSWAAANDAQSGIASYKIFRDGAEVGTSNGTSFTDTGRTANVNYSYTVAAVNGQNIVGPQSAPLVYHITPLPVTLRLQTRDSYLPGVPVLVRIEIAGTDGKIDRSIWDSTATLSSSNPAVTLDATSVHLYNGIGSALVTFTGNGPFTLNATANGLNASKGFTSLAGVAQTNVSGTLAGAASTWSGVVHVTGNVTVPAGHTLTINPGTLILVDGIATVGGNIPTNANSINVAGSIQSLGTAASPVTFTATNPTAPWGSISHTTSTPSLYQYTDITRAGHSTRGGHTNTGPAIRANGASLTFEHSNITDIAGKTMQGDGSNLVFRDTLFTRSAMGPELDSSGLLMQDGNIIDMLGIYREDGTTDDDDGIYVHRQGAGQTITISGGLIAHTDDDGIDTLGPDTTIENIIIRDLTNTNDDPKGITIIEGINNIRNVLMSNVDIGISAKVQGSTLSTNNVDHVTIQANSIAIQAENKFGVANATINYNIKNSILRAPDGVRTDYDPAQITINYSNIAEVWPGTGNSTADPLFVNAAGHNYRLQAASPAIDAGDPASPVDPDGSRTDQGFYTYFHHPRVTEVLASSSTWSAPFLAKLAADNLGSGGYRVALNAANPVTLPFNTIDRVSVRFSEAVSVATSDLILHGVNTPNYAPTGVTYDPATFTATWTLAAPIPADKLLVRVRDTVLDATGGSLDGEPTASFPSGNGTPGGDFTMRFNLLPGDVNQDGVVTTADMFRVRDDSFRDSTMAGYRPQSDIDGDGIINYVDVIRARDGQAASLPAGTPSSPSAPSAILATTSRRAIAVDAALASSTLDDRAEAAEGIDLRAMRRLTAIRRAAGERSAAATELSQELSVGSMRRSR